MVTSTSTPGSMEMEVICLTTSGRVEIDETLVDAHLETIPRVGTLTARRLPRGDAQLLGWHAHGSLDPELLALGAADQVGAHLLEVLHVPARERDPDLVDDLDVLVLVAGLSGLHRGHSHRFRDLWRT